VSRRFSATAVTSQSDFHASQVAILSAKRSDQVTNGGGKVRVQRLTAPKCPLIKGSKNVKFRPLRAIFRAASENSTNKGIATLEASLLVMAVYNMYWAWCCTTTMTCAVCGESWPSEKENSSRRRFIEQSHCATLAVSLALVKGRERIYFEHFWNDFAADRRYFPHRPGKTGCNQCVRNCGARLRSLADGGSSRPGDPGDRDVPQ
jgi:hypothetical protein